jgi:uncharacterized membrane protein YgcG
MGHGARAQQVHLVTQARRPMSEDIRYRQHRYLLMMGIRTLCFAIAIVLFVAHLRWLVLVPAVGAIVIPYIAVIFANGGREPDNTRGFLEHRSRLSSPTTSALARREPPRASGAASAAADGAGGGSVDFRGSGSGAPGSGGASSGSGGDES